MNNRKSAPNHSQALAPPPLIYAVFFAAGLGFDNLWPIADLPLAVRLGAGGFTIAASLMIATPTLLAFKKHRTSLHVYHPTAVLITEGVYRYSRNPAYVALTLLHIGASVALSSVWALILVIPAIATVNFGVIAREERYLERTFGERYTAYRSKVRRWI